MLDAIAQTLAAQAAKPVPPAHVGTQAARVASQQAPVLKPTISAPESISPSLPQATSNASEPLAVKKISHPASNEITTTKSVQPSVPLPPVRTHQVAEMEQAIDIARQQPEQATVSQRLLLKQRLADIVAREKPLKEARLRAYLEAMAIAFAQAGQFVQARQTAQDAMLSPEVQANLLAQIDAIAVKQPLTRPTLALKPVLPKQTPVKVKAWIPTTLGRSLPTVLPSMQPSNSSQFSDLAPVTPQYVSYSLNRFGRTIGGIGVIIDGTSDFSSQNWTIADAVSNRFNAELWSGLSFIFPLAMPAPITSGFGWRVHPIRGDRRFHSGTDLGAPMGTPVLAAADGKVVLADHLGGYGLAIILSHQSDTRETLYGHLSALLVKPGQWVEKGTVIGRVGSTGLSTGPHLHFELRQKTPGGWQAIDPGVQLKSALARLVKAMQSG